MLSITKSLFAIAALGVVASTPALAQASERVVQTTANVYQWWDRDNPVGTATLTRSDAGITAVVHTSGLPPGQAVTLWFIFFNKPENCLTSPCSVPADVFTPSAEADFHFGSGHVVGGEGTATFAAHLSVGDTSGSGKVEIGAGDGVPLTDPLGAEVVLALHVHGPAQKGQTLKSQISSYLGGCEVFLGPDGFAAGPNDVPHQKGECATTQISVH